MKIQMRVLTCVQMTVFRNKKLQRCNLADRLHLASTEVHTASWWFFLGEIDAWFLFYSKILQIWNTKYKNVYVRDDMWIKTVTIYKDVRYLRRSKCWTEIKWFFERCWTALQGTKQIVSGIFFYIRVHVLMF